MKEKCFYRGYYLGPMSSPADDGRYRARVAIMSRDSNRTRSQRFLDMETYPTEIEADERAIAGGKEWIDTQMKQDRMALPTDFAPIW